MMVLADATLALVLGALWLREAMTWRILVAAVAVLAGFVMTVSERNTSG